MFFPSIKMFSPCLLRHHTRYIKRVKEKRENKKFRKNTVNEKENERKWVFWLPSQTFKFIDSQTEGKRLWMPPHSRNRKRPTVIPSVFLFFFSDSHSHFVYREKPTREKKIGDHYVVLKIGPPTAG